MDMCEREVEMKDGYWGCGEGWLGGWYVCRREGRVEGWLVRRVCVWEGGEGM